MLFNSIEFAVYLPFVFILYWFVVSKDLKLQNVLLVLASYVFYGWWDWRFLLLIAFSSFIDYTVGLRMEQSNEKAVRKRWLWFSLFVNLGFLFFFKYFNFFAENFANAFTFFGTNIEASRLNIILPVGISFYTFQTLSYSIDVYRGKLKAEKDVFAFFAYVSFFPQLVAGPIERATNLLPQFTQKRHFDYTRAADGMRQILWGLFKKVVVADNCAEFANLIFNNSADYSGSTLLLGAIFFTFQIYGDFSGYSDIAIGVSRLFGFNLQRNFAFPYFSRDIAEFWRRWHISLSSWFKDYLYIPLGGSRGGDWMRVRNTFAIFLVSGFWHGANWTFIAWGALNALYIMPSILLKNNRRNIGIVAQGKYLPSVKDTLQILFTFGLTVIAWIFFRAENIGHACVYISDMFSSSFFSIPDFNGKKRALIVLGFIVFLQLIEWLGREQEYGIAKLGLDQPRMVRYLFYYVLILTIAFFKGTNQEFIYFQF